LSVLEVRTGAGVSVDTCLPAGVAFATLSTPPEEIRVWDTTADHRYMVLPIQPPATIGWPEEKLAKIVTQDSMIGASRLEKAEG
jgi:nitrile hydratase alpha subunit